MSGAPGGAGTLLGEFATPDRLLAAARRLRGAGYRALDAYTPLPVEGLHELVGERPTRLGTVMLATGLAVAALGFGVEWYSAVFAYPYDVGGRPFLSWQVFLLAPFYVAVLAASVAGVLVLALRGGLLRLHHPLFAVEGFERASRDRFFLAVAGAGTEADQGQVRDLLTAAGAETIREVPP